MCVVCEENEEINEETQEHVYTCKSIRNKIEINGDPPNLKEIFGNKQNTKEIRDIVIVFGKIMEERENHINTKNIN